MNLATLGFVITDGIVDCKLKLEKINVNINMNANLGFNTYTYLATK